jgi:predicted transposase/invertase (TIGR01784 family)
MPDSKSEPTLAEPHDSLVRWAFSHSEHAAGVLKAGLPSELTGACDWGTLRLEKDSFVSEQLRKHHSDLVFSVVAAGHPLLIYVLFEHQRKVEALMAYRMLVYMTRLWEQYLRDHPEAKVLPAVIPVLLHHSDTGWTAATAFEDLIGADAAVRAALERHIPRFEMRLIDVSPDHASELADAALTALGTLVLWCLSVADDDERMRRELPRLKRVVDELIASEGGLDAFGVLVRYLAATHQRMKEDEIVELFKETAGPKGKEAIVTFWQEVELRGEARGKLEGMLEGKLEGMRKVLLNLLAARFGRVPARIRARIQAADEAALGRWSLRVLTAASCAEVISDAVEGTGGTRAGSTKRTTVAHRRGAAKRA